MNLALHEEILHQQNRSCQKSATAALNSHSSTVHQTGSIYFLLIMIILSYAHPQLCCSACLIRQKFLKDSSSCFSSSFQKWVKLTKQLQSFDRAMLLQSQNDHCPLLDLVCGDWNPLGKSCGVPVYNIYFVWNITRGRKRIFSNCSYCVLQHKQETA